MRLNGLPLLAALLAAAAGSLLLALGVGSVSIPVTSLWTVMSAGQTDTAQAILLQLRLPRAGAAMVCGGLLGLAGALMQVLLRNPLADPYILGVSGGAAFAALCAMLLGASPLWFGSAAFAGALTSMLLVFVLARGRGNWTPTRLLLTGVVIAAAWGAGISFVLSVSPMHSVHGMLFWLMGDLANARWSPWVTLILAAGLAAGMLLARTLNVLTLGGMQAQALGVPVLRLQILLYLLGSLLTACAVTLAGSIGFVGLIVPHILRLLGARDHRILIPASVLAGGTLLVLADTLARTLVAPQQLPVGVLTALIGAPVFLFLLNRAQGRAAV